MVTVAASIIHGVYVIDRIPASVTGMNAAEFYRELKNVKYGETIYAVLDSDMEYKINQEYGIVYQD